LRRTKECNTRIVVLTNLLILSKYIPFLNYLETLSYLNIDRLDDTQEEYRNKQSWSMVRDCGCTFLHALYNKMLPSASLEGLNNKILRCYLLAHLKNNMLPICYLEGCIDSWLVLNYNASVNVPIFERPTPPPIEDEAPFSKQTVVLELNKNVVMA
jgi:hypothetical protein